MKQNGECAPMHMMMRQLVHLSKYHAMCMVERFDLKPSQAGILFTLNQGGKLSQRELAERIGVTPPSMTVALRKMEDRGYVIKKPDENDQRVIRIELTEKGRACVGEIQKTFQQFEEIMYQGITTEEKLLLRRLLKQMEENLLNSKDFKGVDIHKWMRHGHRHMDEEL